MMRGEVRDGRREGVGAVAAQAACTGRAQLKARAERTQNMSVMSVTLDVSKLSGWLNAIARCHVKCRDRGHTIRDEVRAGRRDGVGRRRRKRRARGVHD